MEYAFNEILLVRFLTRYYAFEHDQNLVKKGRIIVGEIIQELIEVNKKINNLKKKDVNEIVGLLLG